MVEDGGGQDPVAGEHIGQLADALVAPNEEAFCANQTSLRSFLPWPRGCSAWWRSTSPGLQRHLAWVRTRDCGLRRTPGHCLVQPTRCSSKLRPRVGEDKLDCEVTTLIAAWVCTALKVPTRGTEAAPCLRVDRAEIPSAYLTDQFPRSWFNELIIIDRLVIYRINDLGFRHCENRHHGLLNSVLHNLSLLQIVARRNVCKTLPQTVRILELLRVWSSCDYGRKAPDRCSRAPLGGVEARLPRSLGGPGGARTG